MYRERGLGGSKATEVVGHAADRKQRINDALDKQLERSSPSTSRAINGKDKPLIMGGKQPPSDLRDSRSASASASLTKNNCSDGTEVITAYVNGGDHACACVTHKPARSQLLSMSSQTSSDTVNGNCLGWAATKEENIGNIGNIGSSKTRKYRRKYR
ncbi:hypothetical protein TB2_023889 [Malus domestica]